MKRDKAVTTKQLDPEPVIHYGAPRELDSQVSFALSSLRVVAGFLGASRYGTCEDVQETEAAGEVLDRASEFLEALDFSRVTMKPETGEEE
jgi:hypothetical protein